MGIEKLFAALVKWTIGIIPTLVKANRDIRSEVREVIESIADELIRGLDLVILYLRGAKNLKDNAELKQYLNNAPNELFIYHREFKICRGLRELRDRVEQWFDPTKMTFDVKTKDQAINLIYELEKDERLIMDELHDLWAKLGQATSNLNGAKSREKVIQVIDKQIESLEKKKIKIRESARKIIDIQ